MGHQLVALRQAAVAAIAALIATVALPADAWAGDGTAAAAVSIEWWIYLAVLGGLVASTWLLHVAVRHVAKAGSLGKKHGVSTLVLGVDNRTSTSKLQAFLWTYAVLWALISLLIGAGVEDFNTVLNAEPREEYLLLLGGPFAAAIAAKAITTQGNDSKDVKQEDKSTVAERVVEVVANDEGGIDLGDFQYAAFTLVALTYFALAFIKTPADGLPPIPATLLVLTGVSLSAYVAKKSLKTGTGDTTGEVQKAEETKADKKKTDEDK